MDHRKLLQRNVSLLVFGISVPMAAGAIAFGTTASLNYMETPEFCGSCHSMTPEFQAHAQSPHRTTECGACHIGPGVANLVRTKLRGSVEVMHEIAGTYSRPILPPAGHGLLHVDIAANCGACHGDPKVDRDRLVERRYFREDETNSEQAVALVVKIADQAEGRRRGIHWHIAANITYLPRDERETRIDYVRVAERTGPVKEYVSQGMINQWPTTGDLLAPMKAADQLSSLTCLTCHNRAGHAFLSPNRAFDDALATGKIDRSLPYVKREGMKLLTADYSSTSTALAAMNGLESYYRDEFPALYAQKRPQIEAAAQVLRQLYPRVASPEMRVTTQFYPSLAGHQDSAGCFRCHDGAHFLIQDGRPTKTTIPFNCSLCHTDPRRGEEILTVLRAQPFAPRQNGPSLSQPKTQTVSLDVTHAVSPDVAQAVSPDVADTTKIHAANILFDHARLARAEGMGTCASCHQEASCSRCHQTNVLARPTGRPRRRRRRRQGAPLRRGAVLPRREVAA